MAITIKLCLAVLLLGLAMDYCYCQGFPKPSRIITFGAKGFGKAPPKVDPNKLADARSKLTGFSFSPNPCNLRKIKDFRDPAIKGMADPGKNTGGIPSTLMSMAVSRALRGGSNEAKAAKALMDSSRKISAAKTKGISDAKNRAKRQAEQQPDSAMSYLSDTVSTEICSAKEKLVMSVTNQGSTCYVIQPQEVKMWECASQYARGMINPYPFLQKYYCEPGNFVDTFFYVVCPYNKPYIRIHELVVPINCECATYQCNFEPYQADGAQQF